MLNYVKANADKPSAATVFKRDAAQFHSIANSRQQGVVRCVRVRGQGDNDKEMKSS